MSEKKSRNGFVAFVHRHPVLVNLIGALLLAVFLVWFLCGPFLSILTRHGEEIEMPNVKELSIGKARALLSEAGFVVLVDSIYDSSKTPGMVIEQVPSPKTYVKEGREVKLVYVSYNAKLVKVPNYYNMTQRQALAAFESIGVTHVTVQTVPSEHTLVIHVKYNNSILRPGQEIPADAVLVLQVGAGTRAVFGEEMKVDFYDDVPVTPEYDDDLMYHDAPTDEYETPSPIDDPYATPEAPDFDF